MPWVNLKKAEISSIMCSLPWRSSQAAGGMLAWSVSPRSSLERSLFLLEYQDRRLRYIMRSFEFTSWAYKSFKMFSNCFVEWRIFWLPWEVQPVSREKRFAQQGARFRAWIWYTDWKGESLLNLFLSIELWRPSINPMQPACYDIYLLCIIYWAHTFSATRKQKIERHEIYFYSY